MNKKDAKDIFEKDRKEAEKFVGKNILNLPKEAGSYNIVIEGFMTFVAIYADFDGEKWTDMKQHLAQVDGDESKISYYRKAPVKTKKIKP